MNAEEIKALREKRGWTQARLARHLGVSVTTVSRWETGHYRPLPFLAERMRRLRQLSQQ